jgi:kynurenine formamidase
MIANRSNWGRWGTDDERGTLNLLSPEHVRKSFELAESGRVYSLGAPVGAAGPIGGDRNRTHHYMTAIVDDPEPGGFSHADDSLVMHCHSSTHIDGFAHHWSGGQLYNGISASTVVPEGAQRCGVENIKWAITRGVLLDIPRVKGVLSLDDDYPISGDDLDQAVAEQRLEIRPADVVLVRTGWYSKYRQNPEVAHTTSAGLGLEAMDWVTRHDLVALGADNAAVEIWPPQVRSADGASVGRPGIMPIHELMLRDLGGYLMEYLNLDEIARDEIDEFLLIVAPLRITGGIGSPVNPLVIA